MKKIKNIEVKEKLIKRLQKQLDESKRKETVAGFRYKGRKC